MRELALASLGPRGIVSRVQRPPVHLPWAHAHAQVCFSPEKSYRSESVRLPEVLRTQCVETAVQWPAVTATDAEQPDG